jgi:hypothetical protein
VPEPDPVWPVLADDPAPQRVVEVHDDAFARQAHPGSDVSRVRAGNFRQHSWGKTDGRHVSHLGRVRSRVDARQQVHHVEHVTAWQRSQTLRELRIQIAQPLRAGEMLAAGQHSGRVVESRVKAMNHHRLAGPPAEPLHRGHNASHGLLARRSQLLRREGADQFGHEIVEGDGEEGYVRVEPAQTRALVDHLTHPAVERRHVNVGYEPQAAAH